MTARRTQPAADEAACPVAPLARELARIIRARRKLDDEAEAEALLKCTEMDSDDPVGPVGPKFADALLLRRYDAVEGMARQLRATSKLGAAFQLLLAHTDNLYSVARQSDWQTAPQALRDLSERMDGERAGMIWAAYNIMTAGWSDPDLATLESILGRETFTDAECVERVLKAVA